MSARGVVVVACALVAGAGAALGCLGREAGKQTTVTSASQGATMTGTGATGGSTPETDMQGTGRVAPTAVVPRELPPPPPELPTAPTAGIRAGDAGEGDAGERAEDAGGE